MFICVVKASPNVLVTEGQNAPQPAPAEPKEVAKEQSPERPVDIVNQEDFQSRKLHVVL